MKNKSLISALSLSVVLAPLFAFAATAGQACVTPVDIIGLFKLALCVLDGYVVKFLIALGLIIFLIGVLNYVRSGDNEEKRQAGRDLMWFGIIALFVMIGVWGFVNILYHTFFGRDTQFSSLPKQATSIFEQ